MTDKYNITTIKKIRLLYRISKGFPIKKKEQHNNRKRIIRRNDNNNKRKVTPIINKIKGEKVNLSYLVVLRN